MSIEQNTAKERGLAALSGIRATLLLTGDLEGEALATAMARPAGHEDTGQGRGQCLSYPSLREQERPQAEPLEQEQSDQLVEGQWLLVARKESCRSIWCPVCFRGKFAPKQKERMARLAWQKTRMLTLTFDRAITGAGEAAYLWYRAEKPIGRFIQNLGRAGIVVEDWTSNLEWHDDGTPHFHLLIQVSKAGSAGKIGEKIIHQCWPYGRIHEYFFKTESDFLTFLGYFGKTGYLHKNKQHQITLPAWAAEEHWRGKRINRFSSMKHPLEGNSGPSKYHPYEAEEMEAEEPISFKTYQERISNCGQETNFWVIAPGQKECFVQRLMLPYREVTQLMSGKFEEGLGFVIDGSPWLLLDAFRRYTDSDCFRGVSARPGENGPPNELVGAGSGGDALSTVPSSSWEVACEGV